MPADPIHPDQLDGHARFRADLAAYLDSLPVGELASHRQQPLQLGPLMVALNERLPDVYKLLPPAGHPGPGEGRRHSLREVVADRRAANRTWPPPPGPAERHIDPQRQADLHAERARAGAVAERRGGGDAALTPPIPTRRPAARSPVTAGRAGARLRARGRLRRQLAQLPGAGRRPPPDLWLDAAAAATARREQAAPGPQRPGARQRREDR